ncbi:hypothetical protein FNV43_RR08696 [Rhamnella rubrinervis]|uniref:LysM domain-containing protein n=1 Tax=Rhamnella rubrinervis TaxID=2594499 RepID=A0A8K0H9P9_9ROSA|nr:hypothetical protein FNV43_RR08696 [Rhamnella rubrinervis]
MAKYSNKVAVFANLVLLFSVVLMISTAQSKLLGIGFGEVKGTIIECKTVYGVGVGDTCSLVTQMINQSLEAFLAINPNINCDKMFVGQWVCIDGKVID